MDVATRLLQTSNRDVRHHGAMQTPVYNASVYAFQTYSDFLRARDNCHEIPCLGYTCNPTVQPLEAALAALEHAEGAVALPTGMSASAVSILSFVTSGDHILLCDSVFPPVRKMALDLSRRFGIDIDFFPSDVSSDLSMHIKANTRLIYLETPGSLTFDVQDIQAVTSLARPRGILTILDNSCATPCFQNPLDQGIDIVVHSGSKYLSGHADVSFGALVCSNEYLPNIRRTVSLLGLSMSPDAAFLAMRGLQTLPMRMQRHSTSGLEIACWLQSHPGVREVLHPMLMASGPHNIAAKQQTGHSGVFAFRLRDTNEAACHAFVDSLHLFAIGAGWGCIHSIALPLGHYHADEPAWRERRRIDSSMIRLSIGIENTDDLIADLASAFVACSERHDYF
jgi:cystathionine beta-lyase